MLCYIIDSPKFYLFLKYIYLICVFVNFNGREIRQNRRYMHVGVKMSTNAPCSSKCHF